MTKFANMPHRHRSTYKTSLVLAGIGTLLLSLGRDARAQVTLNLTPASGTGSAGSTIIYYGTISNLTASDVTLNSASFGSLSPATSQITENDDGLFFGTLAANQTYTGDIFSVTLASTITTSTYQGSVGILYNNGASISNFQNFIINATGTGGALPEPGSLPLALSGSIASLGAVVAARGRRRRKANR